MKLMNDIAQWISNSAFEKPLNLLFTPQNENGQNLQQLAYFPSIAAIMFVFWQLGMILVFGFNIICYVSYVRRLNKNNISADQHEMELLNSLIERKNTPRLYKNSIVKTPISIGFFRPAVILPNKKYEDMKLQNILLHEITHMKRYDIFVKWLLVYIGAIHWFNPFVYFVRREMNKTCELACDESVIKSFDISRKQQYGDTLISVAADSIRKMPLSIAMFENKKNLKERLDAIMKHNKHSKRTVIAASVILVTIVCAILGFSSLYVIENKYNYAFKNYSPEHQMQTKSIKLRKILSNYDKKNIAEAYVYLNHLDGEIKNAYILIICQEKKPDSEVQSEIKSLVSEELELDTQNIYVDYIDLEYFLTGGKVSE